MTAQLHFWKTPYLDVKRTLSTGNAISYLGGDAPELRHPGVAQLPVTSTTADSLSHPSSNL